MKCLRILCGILLSFGLPPDQPSSGETNPPLNEITFVAFDLETTGFSSREHRIIEIGAVQFKQGKEIGRKHWLIHPGVAIPEASRRIHGITDEMVAGSPAFAGIYPEFSAFIRDAVLLAHNANFDIRFLASEIERNGFPLPDGLVLDTLSLARSWFPDLPNHKLETLAEHLALDPADAHRASADAARVMNVFLKGTSLRPEARLPRDFAHAIVPWPGVNHRDRGRQTGEKTTDHRPQTKTAHEPLGESLD